MVISVLVNLLPYQTTCSAAGLCVCVSVVGRARWRGGRLQTQFTAQASRHPSQQTTMSPHALRCRRKCARFTSFAASKPGRIKASAGPGAVPNVGPLQTYNQLTTPTNCGPPKLRARVLQHP